MTFAIGIPLLLIAALAVRDVRLRRQLREIRAAALEPPLPPEPAVWQPEPSRWQPEPSRWQPFSDDVGAATEAYAAYLNAPRDLFEGDEQEMFEQDLVKARAAMERAWLEAKPVQDAA